MHRLKQLPFILQPSLLRDTIIYLCNNLRYSVFTIRLENLVSKIINYRSYNIMDNDSDKLHIIGSISFTVDSSHISKD